MKGKFFTCMVLAGCGILLTGKPALAYLDPGTGSAILQGVLAALAASAVALKLYWHRLLRLLGLKKNKPASAETEAACSKKQPPDDSES